MPQHWFKCLLSLVFGSILLLNTFSATAEAQEFPAENSNFIQIQPTVPNEHLDFTDGNDSCCAKDYPIGSVQYKAALAGLNAQQRAQTQMAVTEFEANNPSYSDAEIPAYLIECEKYAQYPELAASGIVGYQRASSDRILPVEAYSMHVSTRIGAEYASDPKVKNTSHFHLEAGGGQGLVRLHDVRQYSVCMARGNNRAVVANTDNGSIVTYNGNDLIVLAGNNTNMLTRTGDGEDVIELYQATQKDSNNWVAYNIYKSALSGGAGQDTIDIKNTPPGTKWCHIGSYKIYGEVFHVIEFAMPPSVTEGPRRQRVNIGKSIETVIFKGQRYSIGEFLNHGQPDSVMAQQ